MIKPLIVAIAVFAGSGASFVFGRETAPLAYIRLGSYSVIQSAEIRNVGIHIVAENGEVVCCIMINSSIFIRDDPFWRTAYYKIFGQSPCVVIQHQVYQKCDDVPAVIEAVDKPEYPAPK